MNDKTISLEELADTGSTLEERFAKRIEINVPPRRNDKLKALIDEINRDDDLYSLWLAANVTAMERLGMTDHGPVHVKIIMNIALKILRMLADGCSPRLRQQRHSLVDLSAHTQATKSRALDDTECRLVPAGIVAPG